MKMGKGPPELFRRKAQKTPSADEASALALHGLAFLAEDMERLERFLALTGLEPGNIREMAQHRSLHLALLDHLAGDEALLLEFAARQGVAPEAVGRARRALGGGDDA